MHTLRQGRDPIYAQGRSATRYMSAYAHYDGRCNGTIHRIVARHQMSARRARPYRVGWRGARRRVAVLARAAKVPYATKCSANYPER
jgi:hypothetical protein